MTQAKTSAPTVTSLTIVHIATTSFVVYSYHTSSRAGVSKKSCKSSVFVSISSC